MKRLAFLLILTVAGCESDADKLNRLQSDALIAKYAAKNSEEPLKEMQDSFIAAATRHDTVAMLEFDRRSKPLYEAWKPRQTEADLAARALNRFMSGQ